MTQATGIHVIGSMRLDRGVPMPMVHRSGWQFCGDPFAGDATAARGPASFHGTGRSRYVPAMLEGCTVLASLRGVLQVDSADGVFVIRSRQFLCLPNNALRNLKTGHSSQWLLLRLPEPFLLQMSRGRAFRQLPEPFLLPAVAPLTREMLICAAALLRAAPCSGASHTGDQVVALLLSAIQAQSHCREWVRRAYGRSERHRRRVVVRLLSARNRILNAPFMNHDLEALAAAAMYSPSHFLRSFRDVFGKTPHGLLTETRMRLACELIRGSDLAIGEVAANVGYESRHAFSRLFKRETGVTASDFRSSFCAAAEA